MAASSDRNEQKQPHPTPSSFSSSSSPFSVSVMQAKYSFFKISIYVVGSKLQAYETRQSGGVGIHWNLHISDDLFLCVEPA